MQTLMSAPWKMTPVIKWLTALILLEATPAHVKLDSLEMDILAPVSLYMGMNVRVDKPAVPLAYKIRYLL